MGILGGTAIGTGLAEILIRWVAAAIRVDAAGAWDTGVIVVSSVGSRVMIAWASA